MELDIIGGSYQSPFKSVNSQKTINYYVVNKTQIENNKTQKALYPTPGLSRFATIPGTQVRGIYVANTLSASRCFVVVDDALLELSIDGTATLIGVLPLGTNSSQPVYMFANTNNQLAIVDGGCTCTFMDNFLIVTNNGNLAINCLDLSTNTLTAVTDVDIQPSAINAGRVYFSNSNDFTAWTGADVFTPTFRPDGVLRVYSFQSDIFCFGKDSIERYYNDGATPFVRREGAVLLYGLIAPHSVAAFSNGIFFLGRSERGQAQVYALTSDAQILPISPNTITSQIGKGTNLQECIGYIHETKDGHIWYYLHVPSLDTTFVYDSINTEWHERKSAKPFLMANGETEQGQFRGRCMANWDGLLLFGDRYSGNIFLEDTTLATEDTLSVYRERSTVVYTEEYKTLSVGAIELDLSLGSDYIPITGQGSSPSMMFSISKNKGNSYYNERIITLDGSNNQNIRTRILGIGSASQWGFKFSTSDPVRIAIVGATLRGSVGAS